MEIHGYISPAGIALSLIPESKQEISPQNEVSQNEVSHFLNKDDEWVEKTNMYIRNVESQQTTAFAASFEIQVVGGWICMTSHLARGGYKGGSKV